MPKSQNVVHQYFKKQLPDGVSILVKVNPIRLNGTEITISQTQQTHIREMEFDKDIFDDLKADEFEPCSPMVFNLILSGLAK